MPNTSLLLVNLNIGSKVYYTMFVLLLNMCPIMGIRGGAINLDNLCHFSLGLCRPFVVNISGQYHQV